MSIRLSCPSCGLSGYVPDEHGGRPVRCAKCKTLFKVPGGGDTELHRQAPAPPTQLAALSEPAPPLPVVIPRPVPVASVLPAEEREEPRRGRRREPVTASVATANTTVIIQPRRFRHFPHLVITLFTCGAWFPVWVILWACSD